MSIQISFVSDERRPVALRLLFARFPIEEQQARLTDALKSAERGSLNLDHLLLAEENGQPVGAALTMHQADSVALVWPPVVTCQATSASEVEHALMSRVCSEIDRAGAKLAQVLLSPTDEAEMALLLSHGFERAADMFFLARILSSDDSTGASNRPDFACETFTPASSGRFASVIERSYIQSLDCPFLDGFRNGKDALVSHKLSGVFDPARWYLCRIGELDFGVLLLNEHPDQNAVELVYFGIVPEFRGQGLGRQMLQEGIRAAAELGRSVIFLAVDCGNVYANDLYSELGFSELARRCVMLRRS